MKLANNYGLDRLYTLECNCDVDSLMLKLQHYNDVYEYMHKIPISEPVYTPNDYHLQDQNALSGPDSTLTLIHAEKAWDYTHGDSTVKIGIADWKILQPWNHEDIVGKISYWDTVGGSSKDFHGLFVAGCAAANTDNNKGKSSIGFDCGLMFSSHSDEDAILRLAYNGARVINMSYSKWYTFDPDYQNMINAVTDYGTLVVAAAGNLDSTLMIFPASYANVLSVTSIGFNYHFKSWCDSMGYQGHHNYNDSVDICAPGHFVMGLWDFCPTCYIRSGGTSFASPIVAGTAGLIFSLNKCITPSQVTNIIKSTANDTIYEIQANEPYYGKMGVGALDAGKAVYWADSLYGTKNFIIHNGENVTWTNNKYVDQYIRIEPGGTLSIQSTVFFNPDAILEVRCGGKLIVDGGHLAANCPCSLWDGIMVWGNVLESQYTPDAQGYVELKNGAIIENARIGVKLFGIPQCQQPRPSGGMIIATNSIFRNNQIGVQFYPYENFNPINLKIINNRSKFINTIFETTAGFGDSLTTPAHLAYLEGVRGINFIACTFQNTRTGSITRTGRGNGIFSVNSSFYVNNNCAQFNQGNCVQYNPSLFAGLNYGIKMLGVDPVKTAYIDHSRFTNNYTGVFLSGVELATVIRDTFEVKAVDTASYDTVGGLYLYHCNGFKIEENTFFSNYQGSSMEAAKRIGLIVNNSDTLNNRIYNNYFHNLNVGILAENVNKSRDGNNGLLMKCNDFFDKMQFDIAVTTDSPGMSGMGVKYNQGTNGPNTEDPAGNTFSYSWLNPVADYYNGCENLVYWYHNHDGGYNVYPDHHSSPQVNPQKNFSNPYTYDKSSSCQSSLSTGGGSGNIETLLDEKAAAAASADSVQNLLQMLVDGGETEETTDDVANSYPSQTLEIRNDLLCKSPYLSDSVMVEAASKEDVLPPAIITEIFTANPQSAKSEIVMTTLDNRVIPLSDDQKSQVDQGYYSIGPKESLEINLSNYLAEYSEAFNSILLHYKNDTLNNLANDSVIYYLSTECTPLARYNLAFELLSNNDSTAALDVLNTIPVVFQLSEERLIEHDRNLAYFNILKAVHSGNATLSELSEAHKNTLADIAFSSDGRLAAYAMNMLMASNAFSFREPYILPNPEQQPSRVIHPQTGTQTNTDRLKIYPNPAHTYVVIEYKLREIPADGLITISDMSGKQVRVLRVTKSIDWLVTDVTNLPSGTYLCTLQHNSKIMSNGKFTITR